VKAPLRIDWNAQERVEVRPGIHASTIRSDGLTVSMYRYDPGSRWEEHRHAEDQLTLVVEGEIVFQTPEGELRLGPGEQALIPGGVAHGAVAGSAAVVTLNVWPPREGGGV
jgi:quercetin dioxygenase-like cupin family protein